MPTEEKTVNSLDLLASNLEEVAKGPDPHWLAQVSSRLLSEFPDVASRASGKGYCEQLQEGHPVRGTRQ